MTPVVWVTPHELRQMFNAAGFDHRTRSGEVTIAIRRDAHPTTLRCPEPFCTRSQIVDYRDSSGQLLAIAHRYVRRDGTIGASGRPDPKRMLVDGVQYATRE